METAAREAWRSFLEAWAIPQRLIDAVGVDPHVWHPEFWERMRRAEASRLQESPTLAIVEDIAGGGSVLDVGAGTGRLAIPLAGRGHRVTTVERDPDMARSLAAEAERAGAVMTQVVGAWPLVAGNTGIHDVVLATQVVYDVAGIGGFVEAMHHRSRRGVVVEMTPRHPWTPLSRYFRALHGLERPSRPTVDDFGRVVEEVVGISPQQRHWTAPTGLRFADMQELLAFYRRRLLVPPVRSIEAAALLEPDVRHTDDGWLVLGPEERDVVTLWWRK
ncbi:MAG: methyltransferase domain-containing protein [Acidimicrobiia bacterium]|nr:methyltransferase domain-containing protein [Acidimicrobiia bacterium]